MFNSIVNSKTKVAPRAEWSSSFTTILAQDISKQQCYPEIGIGPDDPPDASAEAVGDKWRKCAGCRWRTARNDPAHMRVPGECNCPGVEPQRWTWDGCIARRPGHHRTHTYSFGECRYATAKTRAHIHLNTHVFSSKNVGVHLKDKINLQLEWIPGLCTCQVKCDLEV